MAGRGYASGRKRRDAILRVAREHFAQYGFEAASINVIAAEAKISRSGLLHHFSDKEDLLGAVIKESKEWVGARIRPCLRHPDGLGVLAAMIDVLSDGSRAQPHFEFAIRLSAEAPHAGHPAHAEAVEALACAHRMVARALRAASHHGYLLKDDATTAAPALLATLIGLRTMQLRDPSIDASRRLRRAIAKLLTCRGNFCLDLSLDELAARSSGYCGHHEASFPRRRDTDEHCLSFPHRIP